MNVMYVMPSLEFALSINVINYALSLLCIATSFSDKYLEECILELTVFPLANLDTPNRTVNDIYYTFLRPYSLHRHLYALHVSLQFLLLYSLQLRRINQPLRCEVDRMLLVIAITLIAWRAMAKTNNVLPQGLTMRWLDNVTVSHDHVVDA